MLRSRGCLGLLVLAAIVGVPVLSGVVCGFLAFVGYLQKEIFARLPHGLGFHAEPAWWPLPVLVFGGLLAALAIRFLPWPRWSITGRSVYSARCPGPGGIARSSVALATLACLELSRWGLLNHRVASAARSTAGGSAGAGAP